MSLWTTQDGRKILIADMSDDHVRNAIRFFKKKGFVHSETILSCAAYAYSSDNMAGMYAEQELMRMKSSKAFDDLLAEAESRDLDCNEERV